MRRLAVVAVLAVGCRRPDATPLPAGEVAAPSASVPILAPALPVDAAAPIASSSPAAELAADAGVTERRCAIAKRDHASRASALADGFVIAGIPFGTCWSGRTSAWSLSVATDGTTVTGLAILHVDADGKTTRRVRPLDEIPGGQRQFVEATLFDFDADGDPELYLAFTGLGAGCDPTRYPDGQIYGFRAGKIVPYAPAKGLFILGLKDVDGDGRPDILTSSPFATSEADPGGPVPTFTPRLVAHSLASGGFSRTDAVAVAEAKALCPGKPTKLPAFMGAGTMVAVGCARLWGLSSDAILALIPVGASYEDDPSFTELIEAKPPLTLR